MKTWWRSRTIWAGISTALLGLAALLNLFPHEVEQLFSLLQIFSGLLTIYFRKTTTVGINTVFADNRISGTRS